jgi:uncharacterized membrane protein
VVVLLLGLLVVLLWNLVKLACHGHHSNQPFLLLLLLMVVVVVV